MSFEKHENIKEKKKVACFKDPHSPRRNQLKEKKELKRHINYHLPGYWFVQAGKSHSQHHQGSAGTYAQVLHFQPRIPTGKKNKISTQKKAS